MILYKASNLVNYYIGIDLKRTGKCRMTTSSNVLPNYYTVVVNGLKKDSPYKNVINEK